MTNQTNMDLGARINAIARFAVAMHQGMDVREITTVGQQVRIDSGRPGWFTDEQTLPLAGEARRIELRPSRNAEQGRAGR